MKLILSSSDLDKIKDVDDRITNMMGDFQVLTGGPELGVSLEVCQCSSSCAKLRATHALLCFHRISK
jgi:hypothetical protein